MKPFLLPILIATLLFGCTDPVDDAKKYFTDNQQSFEVMATQLIAQNDTVSDKTLTLFTDDVADPALKAAMAKIALYNVSLTREGCPTKAYNALYVQMKRKTGGHSYYYIYNSCTIAKAYSDAKYKGFVTIAPNWAYFIEKPAPNGFN